MQRLAVANATSRGNSLDVLTRWEEKSLLWDWEKKLQMEEMSGVEGTPVDRGSSGPLVREGGGVLIHEAPD